MSLCAYPIKYNTVEKIIVPKEPTFAMQPSRIATPDMRLGYSEIQHKPNQNNTVNIYSNSPADLKNMKGKSREII